jgi:BSD domain
LHELHTNPNILLQNPDTAKDPGFSAWQNNFSAEPYTDEIASLLDRYPELRSEMDRLVPEKVSYKDFWMRYLYQKSKIDTDEARRKQLFESNEDENDFDWDGDDEAEDAQHSDNPTSPTAFNHEEKTSTETVKPKVSTTGQQIKPAQRKSSASESSTSFDIVSQSSAIPPMTMEKVDLNSNPY